LKLQTYKAQTMTLNLKEGDFLISDRDSLWTGKSIYSLHEKAYTPWEWHKQIFDRAKQHGMLAFSSPFDETAVDFLETLDVPCYKIASFENIDLHLIRRAARTGKPLIISTGMANLAELEEAVGAALSQGCRNIILLKCTSNYPATPENSNIATIPHMKQLFQCDVGLSDHTIGIGVAIAAVTLGASVIEKHFTLNRADGGVDSVFSLEQDEFSLLVTETLKAWQALGSVFYGPTSSEQASLQFQRSIYVVKDMKEGDILTPEHIRCIRPGHGLKPKYWNDLPGKCVKMNLKMGTQMSWDFV